MLPNVQKYTVLLLLLKIFLQSYVHQYTVL